MPEITSVDFKMIDAMNAREEALHPAQSLNGIVISIQRGLACRGRVKANADWMK
jgi:hypothetical protein